MYPYIIHPLSIYSGSGLTKGLVPVKGFGGVGYNVQVIVQVFHLFPMLIPRLHSTRLKI